MATRATMTPEIVGTFAMSTASPYRRERVGVSLVLTHLDQGNNGPTFILTFMGRRFLVTAGWTLFRRRPPKHNAVDLHHLDGRDLEPRISSKSVHTSA
jgi:hypothetical protein